MKNSNEVRVGGRVRNLRQRSNISLRHLARTAGVSVSYLSSIEKDTVSPTLAMLRKVLIALGTNFYDFFNDSESNNERYFFRKAGMQTVTDADREYTFVLPQRDDIMLEIMDENYFSGHGIPEFETFESDFSGYVVSGNIVLEIGDEPPSHLCSGDAFYVPAGVKVRGYCEQGGKSRLITILYPAKQRRAHDTVPPDDAKE